MAQTIVAVVILGLYSVWFAWPWTGAGFMPDDLMNCHRALTQSWASLAADHVTIWRTTPEYRPLGSLFYRVIYTVAGFDPRPFHAALYVILAINSALTFELVRRLTDGSVAAAAIATVLHAWHGNWAGLHMNTGFIFDVLCYTFFTAALIAFHARRVWLFLALFAASLNAKEMAVSIPVICFAWDRARCGRRASAAVAAVVLTVAFICGRVLATPEGIATIGPYRPQYDAATLFARLHHYLAAAAYEGPVATAVLGFLLGLGAAWTIMRERDAGLAACAILVAGLLPIAFIHERGLDAAYVPALGAAILLAVPGAALLARVGLPGPLAATAAAVLIAGSFHWQHREDRSPVGERVEADHIMEVAREMRAQWARPAPGARVRFVADPFPQFEWNSLFLVRLVYGDMTLEVDRPGRVRSPEAGYAAVFEWAACDVGDGGGGGRLQRLDGDVATIRTE